ncbi:MAG: hypothetical protein QM674_22930, partial [Burkholderiaceae bacterium]
LPTAAAAAAAAHAATLDTETLDIEAPGTAALDAAALDTAALDAAALDTATLDTAASDTAALDADTRGALTPALAGAGIGPVAADALLDTLGWDPVDIEALARAARLPAGQLGATLLLLELDGRIERLADGRYRRMPESSTTKREKSPI